MNKLPLLVFDLDGTLYRTDSSFLSAVREFLALYRIEPAPDSRLLTLIGEPDHSFVDWLQSLSTGIPTDELAKVFHTIELDAIGRQGQLYPGTAAVLGELKSRGYHLFICSNGSRDYVKKILTLFELEHLFTNIYLPRSKEDTKTAMLLRLIEDQRGENGYMVGDRYHDMEAAKKVGFTSVGAAYGYGGDEIEAADIIIHQLSGMLDVIK